MSGPAIIPVTATLEALLAECVGDAPELVKMNDWRTIALRLSRRLEESGLQIRRAARAPEDRAQIVGPTRFDEIVVAIAVGHIQAVVLSTGLPLTTLPATMQDAVLLDMMRQAIADLRQEIAQQKDTPQ